MFLDYFALGLLFFIFIMLFYMATWRPGETDAGAPGSPPA